MHKQLELQLTTLRTAVSKSPQKKYGAFVVIISHRLLFLQITVNIACSFDVHADVTSFKDARSVVTISTRLGCRRSGKLPLWLSYAIGKIRITHHSLVKTTHLFFLCTWRVVSNGNMVFLGQNLFTHDVYLPSWSWISNSNPSSPITIV